MYWVATLNAVAHDLLLFVLAASPTPTFGLADALRLAHGTPFCLAGGPALGAAASAMAADLSAAVRGVAATRVTGLLTEHDPRRARALTGHFAVVDHGHLASTVPTEQPAHAQHNDNSGAVDV